MFQIYFLLVLSNLLCGFILSGSFLSEKFPVFKKISELTQEGLWIPISGAVTFVVGLFALLQNSAYSPIIAGDLLPSLSALLMGMILSSRFFKRDEEESGNRFIEFLLETGKQQGTVIGLVGIVLGLLHLIIPTAILL